MGIDISSGACAIARDNLAALGLARRGLVVCGDWTLASRGPFDVIVSNPPYVARGEIARLAPEVRDHDPWLALDGGEDGLAAYREIIPACRDMLAPGGFIALEVGAGQHPAVESLLSGTFGAAGRRSDWTSMDAGAWCWRVPASEPWRDKLVTLSIARDIFSQKPLAFAAKATRFLSPRIGFRSCCMVAISVEVLGPRERPNEKPGVLTKTISASSHAAMPGATGINVPRL